MMMVNLPGMM